ncbi:MAG TPA: hypothetical protein VFE47_22365 [Tepidisphaeraceae bacterium]|jgi:hypothetical protein|nr:hypothetical protein [Tepidisphaeraceae bacterium]
MPSITRHISARIRLAVGLGAAAALAIAIYAGIHIATAPVSLAAPVKSPAATPGKSPVFVRLYDVHDLSRAPGVLMEGYVPPPVFYMNSSGAPIHQDFDPVPTEFMDIIETLITECIYEADWDYNGGTVASIGHAGQVLIIGGNADVHHKVAALLTQFREMEARGLVSAKK